MSTLETEIKTIRCMVEIYCRDNHPDGATPCESCMDLLAYAEKRISSCPQLECKPTCRKCTIHCFKADYRERITEIMRYAGPRMMIRHPLLTLLHFLK